MWVYDLCSEMPTWDAEKDKAIFKRKPKRIDAREAKRLIKENNLKCVCKNEHGMIYK